MFWRLVASSGVIAFTKVGIHGDIFFRLPSVQMTPAPKTFAIVLGVGEGGTGEAVARAFARLHDGVALISRTASILDSISESINNEGKGVAVSFVADATSSTSLKAAFVAIKRRFAEHQLKVAVFNANSPYNPKPFLELTEEDNEAGYRVVLDGAFVFSQQVVPLFLEHGIGGTLIFTGATSSTRGTSDFAAIAPAKFALRALAQILANEFGPQGIHVVHVLVDGRIDIPGVRKRLGEAPPGTRVDPTSIANAYVYLSQQEPSAWTQELDIRSSVGPVVSK